MLISQTPVRLSMGGGGTDVAAYYEKHGGFWTSAAINQFVYLTVNARTDDNYVAKYSTITERARSIDGIQHELIRETLKFMKMEKWKHPVFRTRGLEINTISDVPTRSGLGVSGAMTVGLLQILHQMKREISVNLKEIAEQAYYIEHNLAGSKSTGKQDQYIAAFGGITSFKIRPSGEVTIMPLELDRHTLAELNNNIVLFGTGLTRQETAEQALRKVTEQLNKKPKPKVITQSKPRLNSHEVYLTMIKEIGLKQREALIRKQPDEFGKLLDEHWQVKQKYVEPADPAIGRAYELAKRVGALGGKVIGASTKGAFILFYAPTGKEKLRQIMSELEMIEIPWSFEFTGSRIVHIH